MKLSEVGFVLPAPVSMVVSIDNRSSKPIEGEKERERDDNDDFPLLLCATGLIFSLEETVTVKFGSKPVVYSRVVMLDRPNAPVFVDKHKQDVIKHAMLVSAPRGTDSGVTNFSINCPFLAISHRVCASPVVKGIKEKELVAGVEIYIWGNVKEREQKEFKL